MSPAGGSTVAPAPEIHPIISRRGGKTDAKLNRLAATHGREDRNRVRDRDNLRIDLRVDLIIIRTFIFPLISLLKIRLEWPEKYGKDILFTRMERVGPLSGNNGKAKYIFDLN